MLNTKLLSKDSITINVMTLGSCEEKKKKKVTVWLKKPWSLFLSTRYPESNISSLSLWEELVSVLDLKDFQSLIKPKETSWLLIQTPRWKSESKAEPNSLQLVSLPPAVRVPSTFHTATRLNLKTRWLCHSHGSNHCNNILKLKIKYESCLLTLSFSLLHEHKTPSSLCVQKAWGRPVLPAKAPSDPTCAGRPLWLCPEDARFPSAVPSQTEEGSNSQRLCRMTVNEWQSQILVPDSSIHQSWPFWLLQVPNTT